MIDLYNNHQNRDLKFKMNITGVDSSKINPRLIIESGDKIFMVKGTIDGDECKFNVPILEGVEKGSSGKISYEAIIMDEDQNNTGQYNKLWEQDFETISKTEVKVLESNFSSDEKIGSKPSVSLTQVISVEEKKVVEEKVDDRNSREIYMEDGSEELEELDDVIDQSTQEELFSYEKFINRKK